HPAYSLFPYTTLFRSRNQAIRCLFDQDIVDCRARKSGKHLQSLSRIAREILRAMHGDIDFAGRESAFDLARENSFAAGPRIDRLDRKSTRLNSSHLVI